LSDNKSNNATLPLTAFENLAKPVRGGNHCLPATPSALSSCDQARITRQVPKNGSKKGKVPSGKVQFVQILLNLPKIS
jgi:hypothetical protein